MSSVIPDEIVTDLGSYRLYLSLYEMIEVYKYKNNKVSSIYGTLRWLQTSINFLCFGNLALKAQAEQ